MPTYVVTSPQGQLSSSQKHRIGADITNIHCKVTGAPAFLAQVIFNDVPQGNYFVGGRLLAKRDHIFVHGQIRAGRDSTTKERLLLDLMNSVAEAAGVEAHNVQVYLVDVPARQVAEYGQILPLPGEEDAWYAALPTEVREMIETSTT